MDFFKSLNISVCGLRVQGARVRMNSGNLANSNSIPQTTGSEPCWRKVITFANAMDRMLDVELVKVKNIAANPSDFGRRFEPAHPLADAGSYVPTPNVSTLVEMSDIREVQRSYEANLRAIQSARGMLEQTIWILRT